MKTTCSNEQIKISDALKELKDIIHEVLDERELEKEIKSRYDFPDFVP